MNKALLIDNIMRTFAFYVDDLEQRKDFRETIEGLMEEDDEKF